MPIRLIRRFALAVAFAATAAAAFAQGPESHEQAVAALSSADPLARAQAVVWLAQRGTERDAPLLHERLRDEHGIVRSYAERALWLVWSRSGDAEIDRLLLRGIEEMEAGEHPAAIATFSGIIAAKPDFAEAWNRRATVRFLVGDYRASLADCDETLKRNPRHFGALSGAGLNYLQLGEPAAALAWFRRALEVNPNLVGVELEIRRLEAQPGAQR